MTHPSKNIPSKPATVSSSRLETYKKHQIQKINSENSQIFERLRNMTPVVKRNQFEVDFQRHTKLRSLIKRRQMRPINLSPLKSSIQSKYLGNNHSNSGSMHFGSAELLESFKAVSDFRNIPENLSCITLSRSASFSDDKKHIKQTEIQSESNENWDKLHETQNEMLDNRNECDLERISQEVSRMTTEN